MAAPQSQRVKVSSLNDDGVWYDRGTGHVTMDYTEQSEEHAIHVMDDDNATLLVHRIRPEVIYRKHQDNKAISWRDPEQHSTEFTLSFEDTVGCCYMWDQIFNIRRNLNFNSVANDPDVHQHAVAKEVVLEEDSSLVAQIIMLEDDLDRHEEEILMAACSIVKLYPSLADPIDENIQEHVMGQLDLVEAFQEAIQDATNDAPEVVSRKATALRQQWLGKLTEAANLVDDGHEVPFKTVGIEELEAVKRDFGLPLYRMIRRAFREVRVASKTMVYRRPSRSLKELLEALPEVARRRR